MESQALQNGIWKLFTRRYVKLGHPKYLGKLYDLAFNLCLLFQHYTVVTSFEWHPKTNALLSCSADRGIIVWNFSPNDPTKLIPTLCAVKELKANLDASWNHRGDKFCIGTASGHVFMGTYNQDLQFWVAISQTEEPPLGKALHKDSVNSVRFDPGAGRVIASASCDGKVLITSAYDEILDTDGTGPFAGVTEESGEILFTFKSNCWNNTLAFSQSGTTLAFSSHDCEMHFIEFTPEIVKAKSKPSSKKVSYKGAPILNGCFIKEDTYIGCGFDNAPLMFKKEGDKWVFKGSIDDGYLKTTDSKVNKQAFVNT